MKFRYMSERMTKRKITHTVKPMIGYLIERGGTITVRAFPYLYVNKTFGKLSHRLRIWK